MKWWKGYEEQQMWTAWEEPERQTRSLCQGQFASASQAIALQQKEPAIV